MTQIKKAFSTGNKPNEVVSVRDHGAVGDGVTDDTAAIQAAINYAVPLALAVDFGNNVYKTSATLNVSITTPGQKLRLKGTEGGISSTAIGPIIELTSNDPATRGYYFPVIIEGLNIIGDGINTTHGIKLYGASYSNTVIRDCFVNGTTQYMIYLEQCWAVEIVNCQIGFGSDSRTTSGTVGIYSSNTNAVHIKDTVISSIGLNFDGIGVVAESCESFSIVYSTIENMEQGVNIHQGNGAITIAHNYFENSSAVQGTRDITVPWIHVGSVGNVKNCVIEENWFLIGNNARNVYFENAYKCAFRYNSHNPGLASPGYYIIDTACGQITIESNYRIIPITTAIDATANANTIATESNLDNDAVFIPAEAFGISFGAPVKGSLNGIPTWDFPDSTDNEVTGTIKIPTAWGVCDVTSQVLCTSAATTGNFVITAAVRALTPDGSTLISPAASSAVRSAPSVANAPIISGYEPNWDASATSGSYAFISVRRNGTNGLDTMVGDLKVLGLTLKKKISD